MQELPSALHCDYFEVFVEDDDGGEAVEVELLSHSEGEVIVEKEVVDVREVFQWRGLQIKLQFLLRLLVTCVDKLDFLFGTVAMLNELCEPVCNLL